MELEIRDEQPNFLSQRQETEFLEWKESILSKCEECNKSGYLEGGKLCKCLQKVTYRYKLLCSNIPLEYQKVMLKDFQVQTDPGFIQIKQYITKLDNARKKGIGLHVYTKRPGSGKTLLASCILHEAMKAGYEVWFTTLKQLIEDIKTGFHNERKRVIMEWAMFNSDFILIDEVDKLQNNEWRDDVVNDFVQRRVNAKRPIITTGNSSIEQLESKHPDHIISRFSGVQYEITLSHKIEYRRDVQKKNLLKELME